MQRPKRPCAAPACAALVDCGYCTQHQAGNAAAGRLYENHRGNSARRGYDWRWRRFRDWFLSQPENVICADCRVKPSIEVHHVKKVRDYPELKLEPSNCRGLCKGCHSARTLAGQ